MTAYVGEIRMFAGNFEPAGWAFCDGRLVPISENDTLFIVIGTTYGGDGQETFALPNLQSRIPIHQGTGPDGTTYQLGEMAGVESVTLTTQQIPNHTHPHGCSTGAGANTSDPTNAIASKADLSQYSSSAPDSQLGTPALNSDIAGGSQPHENLMPYLTINFIISLFGIFPQP